MLRSLCLIGLYILTACAQRPGPASGASNGAVQEEPPDQTSTPTPAPPAQVPVIPVPPTPIFNPTSTSRIEVLRGFLTNRTARTSSEATAAVGQVVTTNAMPIAGADQGPTPT
ncbi:MAG: hypothetical protein N3G20_06140, partial [Verrucomicrobiae bacterium]|nr:hypothetical protein [Verrucomicrobiae bacterium]